MGKGTCRLSTLDFQKKRFFKKVSIFEKKKGFIMRRKVFFALTISDFRAKNRFCFKKKKKKKVFFHRQFPTLLQAS